MSRREGDQLRRRSIQLNSQQKRRRREKREGADSFIEVVVNIMSISSRTRSGLMPKYCDEVGGAESAESTTRLAPTTARRRRSKSMSRRCSRSSRRCSLQALEIIDSDPCRQGGGAPAESVASDGGEGAKSLATNKANKARRRSKRIESMPEISYNDTKKRPSKPSKSDKSASKSSRPKPKRDQSKRRHKTNDDVNVAPRAPIKVQETTRPSPAGDIAIPRSVSPSPSFSAVEDDDEYHDSSCATPKTARAHRRSITFGEGELAEYRWWESPSVIKRLGPCSIVDDVTLSSEEGEELHEESKVWTNSLADSR